MKNRIKSILILASLLGFTACSTTPMNDFFGIEMNPAVANRFKIVSYSDENGAQYASTFEMNPLVFAYAEIKPDYLLLKIINRSQKSIRTNYNEDLFEVMTVDSVKYVLLKGKRDDFPDITVINPGETVQYKLFFPNDFTKTEGMNGAPFHNSFGKFEVWKGEGNLLNFAKDRISEIIVSLGKSTTLVLKPIPQPVKNKNNS